MTDPKNNPTHPPAFAEVCPCCGDGTLRTLKRDYIANIGEGQKITVRAIAMEVCDKCGEEILPLESARAVEAAIAEVKWEVQQHDMFRGWNTWVIYDEKENADNECIRRINESPERDKRSWRVIPKELNNP